MICRKIKKWKEGIIEYKDIVWFGSYGVDENGKAKFVENKENFSTNQQGVCDSLTQRLSILRNELWYDASYGLPLFDKIKSKIVLDSYIMTAIKEHPDVIEINNFNSKVIDNKYSCEMNITSTFGDISLSI